MFSNRNHDSRTEAARMLAQMMRPPIPPPPPQEVKVHRAWVADWTIHMFDDGGPVSVPNAYLAIPTTGKSDLSSYVFMSARRPLHMAPGVVAPEYVVAKFDRNSIRGVTSHNWHWMELGEW